MRQLTEYEQRWIGGIIVMMILCIIPYSIVMETSRQPMIDWGKSILKTNDPLSASSWGEQIRNGNYTNIYSAILYVILDYARALWVIVLFKPMIRVTEKMGFPEKFPPNWLKYLNFYCKEHDMLFKTRQEFKKHKSTHERQNLREEKHE